MKNKKVLLSVLGILFISISMFLLYDKFFMEDISYTSFEDDINIESSVNSYMKDDDLIIEYITNEDKIWIEGLDELRYSISSDKVIIYDYLPSDYFKLHIGEESDIYVFGNRILHTQKNLQNLTYQKDLRHTDTCKISNEKSGSSKRYKSYNSLKKEILIEDKDYKAIINLELTSPYIVSGLIASNDTKVAEMLLIDWKEGVELFDFIDTYDIKENYDNINRTFKLKYGSEKERCGYLDCYNYTEWIIFESLKELPNKNIKISLWTNTFANENIEWVPTIQGFEILEYAAWNVSSAVWVQSKSVADKEIVPTDLFFNPDGTKMYVTGNVGKGVDEYDLSVAWNVSSAVWVQFKSVSGEETDPTDVFFKSDGTKMYVIGATGDDVNEYDLSVAWNVSSAVWLQLKSVAEEEITPRGLFFKSDGTKMYVTGQAGDDVNEYDLSVAWNVSSAVWLQLKSVAGEETTPQSLFFKSDGTKMYVIGIVGLDVNEYDLSVAWNVSSAVWLQLFDVSGEETEPLGLFFKSDGTKMYVIGATGDDVNEYDLPVVNTAPTITANVTKPDVVNQNTNYLVNLTIEDLNVGDTLTGYVQFYVNSTSTSSEQSQTATNGTTTLIGTLSYGNFSGDDNLTAQVWAGDGTANTTKVYLTSSIVTSSPSVTNLIEFPADPATFSQLTMYGFNATITDNGILDDIFLEFDGVNYTTTNISADIFNVSFANLSVGVYNYRWFANDTEGSINNTATGSYTINQATPEGTLTSSLGWTINVSQEVIIGLSEANTGDGDVVYIVHRDNVEKGTGETWTPTVGTYDYVLNTTGGVNWSENISMDTQTLTVNDVTSPNITNLIEFPADPATFSQLTMYGFNATITDNGILDDIFLEFDGVNYTTTNISADIFNVSFANLSVGVYNYRWFANDTFGNLNNTETGSYTINQAISEGTLTSSLGWTINVSQEVIIGLSEANTGDGDVVYIVHRDNVEKGTGETWTPTVGTYDYVLNTTGGVNWSENISMDTQTLTVNDVTSPTVYLILPVNATSSEYINHTFSANITDNVQISSLELYIWNESGSQINNDTINASWIYQEDANETSLVGDWTNDTYTYDGDWDTFGIGATSYSSYLYVNYTTLDNIISVKHEIKIGNWYEIDYYNYNSFTWIRLKSYCTGHNNYTIPSTGWSGQDKIQLRFTPTENGKDFYEEGMWWEIAGNTISLSGTINSTTWDYDFSQYGTYIWNVKGADTSGNTAFAINRTIIIEDVTNPNIVIDFPVDGLSYSSIITELNYTASDTNLNSCWYSLNGGLSNTTVTCGDDVTGLNSGQGSSTWQIWANDSVNNINTTTVTFLVNTIAPNITNLIEFPTDPATYFLGTIYHFNATVTDNGILDDIFLEFNGVNYTATNISADIFNISIEDLQAGVYNYRWFANDTTGKINNTETGSYTIDKATSQTSLTFDVASPQTYGTAITPTCSVTIGDGPAVLKQDGVTITSGAAITLGADTYSFNCSYTENANYTGSQNISSYTIDKAIPIGSLTSTLGWEIDRGEEVIIGLSEANTGDGDVVYIVHRDNIEKGTGETWTPAAGTYTYLLNTTGGANWTVNSTMNFVDLVVLASNPNITTLVEYPSDPVNYSQTTVYQFNATILDANTLDDIIFEFNGTNYTATNLSANVFNVSFTNLTAGTYNYRWFANDTLGNMNNTEAGTYTIDKATPPLTLTATTPITYGTITDFAGGGCPAQLSCSLDISNDVYAAGTKTGNYSTPGNINYTSAYANFTVIINKASLTGTITGVSVINYTNAANITANETNNNDSDVTYILYRNNATVSNPDNTVLGVGTYYYHYNSTGGENYTANISIDNFTLTIDKATAEVYAYISNRRANYAGTNLTAKNEYFNGSLNVGAGNINMYLNDSLIASGTSPLYNITDFPLGSYYFNVTYDGNDNYTSDEEHWSINITEWTLSNLTGIFNLNADTGTTAYDVSGNINNGTISGATWGSDDIDVTLTDAVDYFINKNTGLFVLLNDARDKTLLSITFTYYEYADDFLGEIIIKILPGLLIMLVLIMIFRLFTSRRDDGTEERIYEY